MPGERFRPWRAKPQVKTVSHPHLCEQGPTAAGGHTIQHPQSHLPVPLVLHPQAPPHLRLRTWCSSHGKGARTFSIRDALAMNQVKE